MSIQNLILGNLVSRGADRLLNPNRKNVASIDKFISGGGIGQESEEKDKGPTTFGGIAKQGIMSLIAQAVLGPVFGPLALTLGQNIAAKKGQGLGFNPFGGDGGDGTPPGPGITKALTQEEIYDMDDVDPADYGLVDAATADIQDFADIMPEDSGSDNGGSGGTTSSSDQGETSSDSGFSDSPAYDYARGGLASLYR